MHLKKMRSAKQGPVIMYLEVQMGWRERPRHQTSALPWRNRCAPSWHWLCSYFTQDRTWFLGPGLGEQQVPWPEPERTTPVIVPNWTLFHVCSFLFKENTVSKMEKSSFPWASLCKEMWSFPCITWDQPSGAGCRPRYCLRKGHGWSSSEPSVGVFQSLSSTSLWASVSYGFRTRRSL